MGGHDPYSSSKGCAELVTSAYRSSFFGDRPGAHPAKIASARAGNVIGGGDWADDRLVPDIVRALLANQRVQVRNPASTRPWQHVLEPLGGYLLLAQRLATEGEAFAGGWNFGPRDDDARPVLDIVEKFCSLWPGNPGWNSTGAAGPHEAHYLKLDCSKARTCLGWEPRWNLGQAIERIVDWHQAHAAGADVRSVTLEQIQDYAE
jgi:CDP-glucose 4,6-dehydratase